MYAIPAWYGFLSKNHMLHINSFLSTHSSTVMLNLLSVLEQLLQDYNDKLFHKATYGNDTTHHLLPSLKSSGYKLRTLGHGLCVNFIKSQLHKKKFNDCYQFLMYCIYHVFSYWY